MYLPGREESDRNRDQRFDEVRRTIQRQGGTEVGKGGKKK